MVDVVGVRFKQAGKVYYFSPGNLALAKGDKVIVETARGVEFGELVIPLRQVDEKDLVLPLKQVIRKATAEDEQILENNRGKEKEAFQVCLKKITEHHLPMKLVDVEYTFDGNKIIFSFTADGRVDFRDLVKDLASVFRTRIELRQIGVRDEAKMIGGVGSCGRILCCASFLGDFEPVSIRMAKDQKLSLNPTKISGICGRLMCCLKYENEGYSSGSECGCGAACAASKAVGKQPADDWLQIEKEVFDLDNKLSAMNTRTEVKEKSEVKAKPEAKTNQTARAVPPAKGKGVQSRRGEKPKGKSEKE
ncbi:MAG TPA: stage 0 sporulation family protein [Desulfitobacteriaceae bacterium]|nr:stage 0 sporulation family protein [Desulfitobacteriaceae bacterium]